MTTGARVAAPRAPERDQLATHDQRRRWLVAVREALFIFIATQLYSRVRGIADSQIELAYENADRVIAFERTLHIFVEQSFQQAVIGNEAGVHIANAIYIWGFGPVVILTLAWLILRRPADYALYRNALLGSGAVSLVLFATFPLAPPRFLPQHGFVDIVEMHSSWYRAFNGSAVVNEYAAMPSLHFGWLLLAAIAVATLTEHRPIRIAAVIAPVLMFGAIVVTANHYLVDGLVGAAVVGSGLGIAHVLRRRFGSGQPGGLW